VQDAQHAELELPVRDDEPERDRAPRDDRWDDDGWTDLDTGADGGEGDGDGGE
jgi:hypothetical protein